MDLQQPHLCQVIGSGPLFFPYDEHLPTYVALKSSSALHQAAQIQPGESTEMLLEQNAQVNTDRHSPSLADPLFFLRT